ncbi:hypothetical protein chiPu_0028246, partial [Chiloscyllium punctatum]|nr:hypothetical protein [Chiloscyllium punctatum]
MDWRFVLLGIADRPERVLRLERDLPQRTAGERRRAIGKISPVGIAAIMQSGGVIEDQPDAFERDQAICQLVLDRLELADRLPELVSLPGVVDGQLERAPRSTVSARGQHRLALDAELVEVDAASGNPCERRRVQPDLVEPPRPHRTGRNAFDTGTAELDQRKMSPIQRDQEVRGTSRRLDAAEHARCRVDRDLDRAGAAIGIQRTEREGNNRLPGMQPRQQIGHDVALRSGNRKVGQRRRPHRRRTSGPAKLGHDDEDFGKAAFIPLRPEGGYALPDQLAPDRRYLVRRRRRHRATRTPMLIEESTQGIPQHRRDVIVRLFGRRHHAGLALAEPGLALFLERHRRFLVVG